MVRRQVLTDLDIVRIAECAVQKRRAYISSYCADTTTKPRVCYNIDGIWYFSKAEFMRCAGELGYRVKVETLLRKLRKLASQGKYIAYNGSGGSYKLLVRLEEVT